MPLKKGIKALVAEAEAEIDNLSVDQAKALHGRNDVLFVDLRDVRELWREGTVPGSFHAPRGMLEFWVDPESPYYKQVFAPNKHLILYCASAWRSALAAAALADMGLPAVSHIEGGFSAWKKAGGPVAEWHKNG